MSRRELYRRLRFRLIATHAVPTLSGIAAFLLVSCALALNLPPPSRPDLAPYLLFVLAGGALAGLGASAVTVLAVSNWLFTRIAGPVRRMSEMTRRMARGNYSERLLPGSRAGASGAVLGEIGSNAISPHSAAGAGGGTDADSILIDNIAHVAGVVRDMDEVTEALAAALDELAAALEAAEHRRTLSFGEVAHEIRTPVAVLEGYLEGLLDGHVEPSEKTWAMLYDEASRVHRLVDELQALSSAEARQSHPDLQAIDPALIAGGALERLHLHFKEKGLQVTTEIAPALPLVLADPDQALQALVNLLTNALRYTPTPGQVTLSVSCPAGATEVVFSVKDTGVGIAAEHIPHLFERFFRIDRAGSRKVGGSGIGLPVAKALVEAMGGRIWAESPGAGKGSTFCFTLLIAPNVQLT